MEMALFLGACLLAGLWILAIGDRVRSRACPYCMKRIHRDATRCPYCTSEIEPPPLRGPDAEIAARRRADRAAANGR